MRFVHAGGGRLLLGIVLLAVGFAGGFFVEHSRAGIILSSIKSSLTPIKEANTSFELIEPLLAYRVPEATTLGELVSLKASFQKVVDEALTSKTASRISIYFRDLDAARWVGISQNETYYPASLLKVPVMIAYFKQAERDPSILEEVIVYQELPAGNSFDTPSALVAGNAYTARELIRRMIVDSDNGATFTLLNRINPDVLSAVYTALGITSPGDDSSQYQISIRTYALFFRVLYNATYLSPEYSEKALELLVEASFDEGLAAGVPEGPQVANKFGEHVLVAGGKAVGIELHDCGLIYYPSHPYLLCVMTSAKDVETASALISRLSAIAYGEVEKQYGK